MTMPEIQQFSIILGEEGQITIPQLVQKSLQVDQGDTLSLIQIGNLVLLAPQQPQVPQLIDKIVTLMDNEDVHLSDLLAGLEIEREEIWQEQKY